MRKTFLILTISILSFPSFCQEDNENRNYSIGFTSLNWTNDCGIFLQTNLAQHGFSITVLKSKRIYGVGLDIFSEYPLEAGKTEGYDVGAYYHYSLKKKNKYESSLKFGYTYKSMKGYNFKDGNQSFSYTFDLEQEHHSLKLGYVNTFNFKMLFLNITPIIHTSKYDSSNFNYVVIGDGIKTNQEISKIALRFDLEISLGIQF